MPSEQSGCGLVDVGVGAVSREDTAEAASLARARFNDLACFSQNRRTHAEERLGHPSPARPGVWEPLSAETTSKCKDRERAKVVRQNQEENAPYRTTRGGFGRC